MDETLKEIERPFAFNCPDCGAPLCCNICSKVVTDEETADILLYSGVKFCGNCGKKIVNALTKALTESMLNRDI